MARGARRRSCRIAGDRRAGHCGADGPGPLAAGVRDAAGGEISRLSDARTTRRGGRFQCRGGQLEARPGAAGISRCICKNGGRSRRGKASMNDTNEPSEERLARLLAASSATTAPPDREFLAGLRAASTAAFEQAANSEPPTPVRRMQMFLVRAGVALVASAALAWAAVWLATHSDLSSDPP